jgi:hypothetical protein
MRGQKIYIVDQEGRGRFYTGGQLNAALTFDNLAPIVRAAVTASGFGVSENPGILTLRQPG